MSHSIRRTRPPAARQQHHYQSGADRVITGGGGHNQALQSNADLYQVGKQYAAMQTRLTAGRNKKATWVAVAAESRVDRPIVMEAVNFVEAVDLIVANCGHRAKKLLLSEHRRLPAKVVMKISRTHADKQRYALAQAQADRNPFGKPHDGIAPPFDTHDPAEVLRRLPRNTGAIQSVADGLLDTPKDQWPPAEKLTAIVERAMDIRRYVRSMKPRVASSAVVTFAKARKDSKQKAQQQPTAFSPKTALTTVALATGVIKKTDRELPRVLSETPPTATQKEAILKGLRELDAAANRLIAVIEARDHDPRTGPSCVPGTYIAFFFLTKPATRLKIGALGTFDFPAGYYAYLGSVFGGGGVQARTDRHLTRLSKKRWNVDYLKPRCTPVAVWWTHDRNKVEFDWAEILGWMPGASIPVPRFGAADNPKGDAHLVRFNRMPSFSEFQKRVTNALPGHASIYEKLVENWTGTGWPS